MKNIFKYINFLYRKIDISPLERNGSALRMLIFLVWGINALIFITLDFLPEDEFLSHNIEHSISKYTLELSSADVCIDEEIIFFSTHLGLLSSYDVNPHEFEIILIQRDRSPPL